MNHHAPWASTLPMLALTLLGAATAGPSAAQGRATPARAPLATLPASAPVLSPADEAAAAGQLLYRSGRTRQGGELQAQVGSGVALGGALVACARCHGSDGAGGREAGLIAPPLRWAALTQGRSGQTGLTDRRAYDTAGLLQALRTGTDPDGRALASAMPRFELSPRDAADLLAYLQRLGTEADTEPGVHADRLLLAGVLPLTGPLAAQGQAVRAAVAACIERGNRQGGVFGRRIEWQVHDAPGDIASERALAERLQRSALAVVAPWWRERTAAALADALPGVPIIGPLGAAAEVAPGTGDVYGIAPQLADQARVLVDALGRGSLAGAAPATATPRPAARLLLLAHPSQRAASLAAQRQALLYPHLALQVWPGAGPLQPDSPAALAAAQAWLQQQAPQAGDAVLVLGPAAALRRTADTLAQVTSADASASSGPWLLGSYSQAGRGVLDWPETARRRAVFSHTAPEAADFDPRPLQQDLQQVGATLTEPALQSLGYAASCVAVEALGRAGRVMTRERLRASLDGLHAWRTGVLPPLTFSPRQRNGLSGAALVRVEGTPGALVTVAGPRQAEAW